MPLFINPTVNYRGESNVIFSNNKIIGWEGSISITPPHDDSVSQALIRIENNTVYRDMSYNRPFVDLTSTRDLTLNFTGNSYVQVNPIEEPFRVQNQSISPDEWLDTYESTANISSRPNVPNFIDLGRYLYINGLGNREDMLIPLARQLSRTNTKPALLPANLIEWAHAQFPND